MNRFTLIAVTGFLALLLTACGDNGTSKPAEDTTTTGTAVEQTQPKVDDTGKATGSEEQKPANEQSQ